VTSAIPASVPSPPRSATLAPASNSALRVSWSSPADDGFKGDQGGAIISYLVEWDFLSSFSSSLGQPAGSANITSSALMGIAPTYSYLITAVNGSALTLGMSLFARVSATNAMSIDSNNLWLTNSAGLYPVTGGQIFESTRAYAATTPTSATTAYQPPGPSSLVVVVPLSGSSVRVSMASPSDMGGLTITSIAIQWASTVEVLQAGGVGTMNLTVPLSAWAVVPAVLYTDGRSPLPAAMLYDLTGLTAGVSAFVRVAAINSMGIAPWTMAASSATPLTAPTAPTAVTVRSALAAFPGQAVTTLDVTWALPANNGGAPITGYIAELFSGDTPVNEVQRISVANTLGRSDIQCNGVISCAMTFVIYGMYTVDFPLDETAFNVRQHILTLKNSDGIRIFAGSAVTVTRAATSQGYTWDITFKGVANGVGAGDVPLLSFASSTAGATTYSNSVSNCGFPSLLPATIVNTCLSIGVTSITEGQALYGVGEVQTITLFASDNDATTYNPPTGFFSIKALSIASSNLPVTTLAETPLFAFDASPTTVAAALVTTLGATGNLRGSVKVTRSLFSHASLALGAQVQTVVNATTGFVGETYDGAVYTITFAAGDGDVPVLGLSSLRLQPTISTSSLIAIVSDGSRAVDAFGVPVCTSCTVGQKPPGLIAKVLSVGTTGVSFTNLTSGGRYYVAVSAINALTTGTSALAACSPVGSTYCTADPVSGRLSAAVPAATAASDIYGVTTPRSVPGAPVNVVTVPDTGGFGDKLIVTYNPPAGTGGADIASYRVEWSTAADFSTGLGRLDVPCAAGAPSAIIAITTADPTAEGIGSGTWGLRVTVSGVTGLTQLIRFDAAGSAADELALNGGTSGVFCETEMLDGTTTPINPSCSDSFVINSVVTVRAGSVQSTLEALPFIGVGGVLGVSRASRANSPDGHNEFTWTVTFAPALGGDITVIVAPGRVNLLRPSSSADPIISDSGVTVTTIVSGALAPAAMNAACIGPRTITGLAQGVPVYVHVLAYNSVGYGPAALSAPGMGPMAGRIGSPVAPIAVPGLPTSVGLAPASASQLRVSWGSPLDTGGETITAYSLNWGTTRDTSTGALGGVVGSLLVTYIPDAGPYSRLISGLSSGVDYYVLVAAVNTRGTGSSAATFPAFDHPRTLPASPLSVSLRIASPSSLTVGWVPPSNNGGDPVTQFLVEWDTSADFESSRRLPHRGSATILASTDASTTISNLAAGTAYYVRVSAANQVGFGSPSVDTPASAIPTSVVPGYPSGLGVASSVTTCRTILISFSQPIVPASGIPCGGISGTPTACASGTTAVVSVADGGARISSFEVHYSAYHDFHDVAPGAGGTGVSIIPVASGSDGTAAIQNWAVGITNGAPLQPGSLYYVRVASRNGVGTGPFCANEGPACNGVRLVVLAPAPNGVLACPSA
jgi:hypothetical protein